MITLYGIPNCDTVKKARAWLTQHGLAYTFYDFKKHGVPAEKLPAWLQVIGQDKLLNRQGTTWKKLDSSAQTSAATEMGVQALMRAMPSVIKRPVVEWGGPDQLITAGFNPDSWNALEPAPNESA
jgi:Spx/MgsR family transcriptional regulator